MRSIWPCSVSSATPSFPSQVERKIGFPRGQHKRKPEIPVVTRESHRNSRKTTWFPRHRKMRPLPATASQEKSHVLLRSWDFLCKSTGVGCHCTAVGCHFLLQGSPHLRDQTCVSSLAGGFFTTGPPGKPPYMHTYTYTYTMLTKSIFLKLCLFIKEYARKGISQLLFSSAPCVFLPSSVKTKSKLCLGIFLCISFQLHREFLV